MVSGGARNGVKSVTGVVTMLGRRSSVPRVSGEMKSLSRVSIVALATSSSADQAGISVIVHVRRQSTLRDHTHQSRSGYDLTSGESGSERSCIPYAINPGIGISLSMICASTVSVTDAGSGISRVIVAVSR